MSTSVKNPRMKATAKEPRVAAVSNGITLHSALVALSADLTQARAAIYCGYNNSARNHDLYIDFGVFNDTAEINADVKALLVKVDALIDFIA